jgi:cell division protein FtsW
MLYLPYAHTDFIFPVIGEELGLRVTLIVVFCYLLIVTSGILIALNAKDRFGLLLGFGCTAIVGLQAATNLGVTTSLLPNKGLPLPFISYGGSNLFFCLIAIGILINIYRQGKEDKTAGSAQVMVRVRHVSRI